MPVQKFLLKRKAEGLLEGFERIQRESERFESDEAQSLKIFLRLKREEADMLRTSIDQAAEMITPDLNERFIEDLRRLKHDYHTGHRKWQALYPAHSRRRMNIAA